MHAYLSILPLTLAISLSSTGVIAARTTTPTDFRISPSAEATIAQAKGDDSNDCPVRGCGRRAQNTSDRGSGRFQHLAV